MRERASDFLDRFNDQLACARNVLISGELPEANAKRAFDHRLR